MPSMTSRPKMSPKNAPMLQKMIERHSTFTFMNTMQNPAVTIPENKQIQI